MAFGDPPVDRARVNAVRAKLLAIELAAVAELRAQLAGGFARANAEHKARCTRLHELRTPPGLGYRTLLAHQAWRPDDPRIASEEVARRAASNRLGIAMWLAKLTEDREQVIAAAIAELSPREVLDGVPDPIVEAAAIAAGVEAALPVVRALQPVFDDLALHARRLERSGHAFVLTGANEARHDEVAGDPCQADARVRTLLARAALLPYPSRTAPWLAALGAVAQLVAEVMPTPIAIWRDRLVRAGARVDELIADLDRPN